MRIDSSSLYRDIIKRAFLVTWQNGFLWIFGFFTSFLGLGSMYNFVIKNSWDNTLFNGLLNKVLSISIAGTVISENFNKIGLSKLLLFFLALLLGVIVIAFLIWLAINSFGALIKASQILDKNKKITFTKSFKAQGKKFWPLLLLNLLGKIFIYILLAITGGSLTYLLVNHSVGRALLYFFISLLFVAISLFITFLVIYASCFVVLKSKGFFESIQNAWKLFKKNWVVTVEAAVILFFINLLAKLGFFILLILFSIPFMLLLLLFYSASTAVMPTILLALWIFVGVLLLIFIGSIFSAFQIVTWTFLFDRINKGGVLSKLYRVFR